MPCRNHSGNCRRTPPDDGTRMACSWGEESAEDLLDWLQIPRRHALETDPASLRRSTVSSCWTFLIMTPPKWTIGWKSIGWCSWSTCWSGCRSAEVRADAAIHDRYLKPLAQHSDVMMIILNQVDKLSARQREQCLKDLRRLLTSEGLAKVPVMAVSAVTGEGIEAPRDTGQAGRREAGGRAQVGG